ncbi:MAG: outer membrane beta-barrel protein [Polaribacter sp.]
MRKIVFIAFLAMVGLGTMNAQQGKLYGGVSVGIPTGDVSDAVSFTLGAEMNYMFPVADGFTVGPSVEYLHFFAKDFGLLSSVGIEIPDFSFLPISAAAKYNVSDKFAVGANLGYAVGISGDNNGGFYYRPSIGYKVGRKIELNLSYKGISLDGRTASNVSLGIMYGF